MPEHMMVTPIFHRRRARRPSSATSPTWPRSAGWRPARSRRPRPTSTRRACGCRRCGSSGAASPSRTCGGSCSPTTARPPTSWGDIHAMLGSLRVGERRLRQLFEERGVERLDERRCPASRTSPTRSCARRSRSSPTASTTARTRQDDDGIATGRYWSARRGDRPRRRASSSTGAAPTSRRAAPSTRRTS